MTIITFNNFINLLNFNYGKKQDELQYKVEKKETKKSKGEKKNGK